MFCSKREFKVTRAKQKMDGAIDELKLKLKSDDGQQSADLYNREKNMIVGKDSSNVLGECSGRVSPLNLIAVRIRKNSNQFFVHFFRIVG